MKTYWVQGNIWSNTHNGDKAGGWFRASSREDAINQAELHFADLGLEFKNMEASIN